MIAAIEFDTLRGNRPHVPFVSQSRFIRGVSHGRFIRAGIVIEAAIVGIRTPSAKAAVIAFVCAGLLYSVTVKIISPRFRQQEYIFVRACAAISYAFGHRIGFRPYYILPQIPTVRF